MIFYYNTKLVTKIKGLVINTGRGQTTPPPPRNCGLHC